MISLSRWPAVLGVGLVILATSGVARAQHVVTEAEASKLTLEALTAPPRPVYRPAYRAYFRDAMSTPTRWRHSRRAQFLRADYRVRAHTARQHPSHHRHRNT